MNVEKEREVSQVEDSRIEFYTTALVNHIILSKPQHLMVGVTIYQSYDRGTKGDEIKCNEI